MDTEEPDELNITEVTKDFGETYIYAKEWDKLKDDAQKIFFQAATQELRKQRLPQEVIDVPEVDDIEGWVRDYHPGWKIVDVDFDNTQLILEQDPELMEFVFINPEDGILYKRLHVEAGARLDDERLKDEDPELYEEISEWPEPIFTILCDAFISLDGSQIYTGMEPQDYAVLQLLEAEVAKIIRDKSTWTNEQASRIQKYLLPGKVSVRLQAPRPAKPEDLEENDSDT